MIKKETRIIISIFQFIFFISINGYSQEIFENSENKNSTVLKINPEKLAWEMMYPSHYKRAEKSPLMKSFEEQLLKMKAGTAELSLKVAEFEKRTNAVYNSKK